LANLTVCILKTGNNHGGNPEDGTVLILVTNSKRGLQRHLSLTYASETFDDGTLAVVLIHVRRNSLEKPIHYLSPSHEIPISPKGN
jgi:hypothetical protein